MLTLLAQFGNRGIQPQQGNYLVPTDDATGQQALSNVELFMSQIIGLLTVTASLFFIVYFVMGAFKWTAAGGDGGKVSKARDQMVQGVLGLILIVASYAVIGVIGTLLGLNILNPKTQLENILNLNQGGGGVQTTTQP